MEKYTYSKKVVIMALLSLNILSACVHTRKELGWCPVDSKCLTPKSIVGACCACGTFQLCYGICSIGVVVGLGWGFVELCKTISLKMNSNNSNIANSHMISRNPVNVHARHFPSNMPHGLNHLNQPGIPDITEDRILNAIKAPPVFIESNNNWRKTQ
ncbi:hypothetical protein [Candidatus Cardinium sp. cBcalN1]|uniref:hypothetical protein n=2 Tax=unclassified Candidatus Cardinium TaxID=2641185 RepID=UPI001FB2C80A|nr:hypothetical protein [Candidatus Cardinium sp. cBcalN1]